MSLMYGAPQDTNGFREASDHDVAVTPAQPAFDPLGVGLDAEKRCAVHHRRQRLRAAHRTHAAGNHQLAGKGSAEMPAGGRGKRFEGTLQCVLGTGTSPTPCRHPAMQYEAPPVDRAERLGARVRDQHARGLFLCSDNPNRLAGPDEERVFCSQGLDVADDSVVTHPVANDSLVGKLGYLGVEAVHQHAESGFLFPAFRSQGEAARGANRCCHVRRS